MEINLSISPATSIPANWLVVAIYEATSPNTVVSFQAFAAPHTSARNISFLNVNPVAHNVRIYENATNAVGGTIRHQFLYSPYFKNAQLRDDLFLVADQTSGFPSSGVAYTDASLAGWKWSLERRGFGTMQLGVDYSWDANTNTWTLLSTLDNPTPNIEPDEVFIISFQPKITTVTSGAVSNGVVLFSEVLLADANVALTDTVMGKAVHIAGTSTSLSITLPDLTTILANRPLIFMSNGGNHINAIIKSFAGQIIDWLEGNLSEVIIGQSEQIWLYKWVDPNDSNVYRWRVLHSDGNFKTAGEIVHAYYSKAANTVTEKNTVFANGVLLSRTVYKRLWSEVQKLDASMLVSDGDWNNGALNNKGKFSQGDGVTNFRVPLLYAPGFLKAVDGATRKAGSWEAYKIGKHKHEFPVAATSTPNGALVYTRGGAQSPGPAYTMETGGDENSPNNTGVYLSIRI